MAVARKRKCVKAVSSGVPWDWDFDQPANIAENKREMGITPTPKGDAWWEKVRRITGNPDLGPDNRPPEECEPWEGPY